MGATARPRGASVPVGSGVRSYEVRIAAGILGDFPELISAYVDVHRLAVISDDNVAPLHGRALADRCRAAGIDTTLLTFPAGEASKTRERWSMLTDEMLAAGMGRDTCVVAVGGGVTCDLAGFVAATYMRGLPVVQVPTSYLAMLDAAVGGKTGVDVRAGKNLVGAFHPPTLVVADPEVLATLPTRERSEGLVEAFKHGAILDRAYFESLVGATEALLAAEPEAVRRAVLRSVELKSRVVSEDELESGLRQILNFGHTVGHALEAASDYALGHGSAVALGMVVEAEVGERMGVTEPGTADRLRAAVTRLLGGWPATGVPERAVEVLSTDKKNRRGRVRCVLLGRIGEVDPGEGWTHEVADAIVVEAMQSCLGAS